MTTQAREILWTLTLAGGFFGMLLWLAWASSNRRQWLYAAPPLSYLIHVVVYFTARLAVSHEPLELFQVWSTILTAHAVGIAIGICMVWLRERRNDH